MKSSTFASSLIVFISIVLLQISCSTGYYTPVDDVLYSPTKKGEITASVRLNATDIYRFQGNLSYAPTNHIGVSLNTVQHESLRSYSMAVGYRTLMLPNRNQFFDVYGGYSYIQQKIFYNYGVQFTSITGQIDKLFLQTGYHYIQPKFRFDLALKYSFLDWNKIDVISEKSNIQEVEYLRNNDRHSTIDLIPKFTFGNSNFNISFGCVTNVKGVPLIEQDKLIFISGVNINLNHLYKNL